MERYVYDAYGNVAVLNGTWAAQAPTVYNNEILFAGNRREVDTGLYQVRYRSYHPSLGSWMTRDPLRYVDGQNLYQYCDSAPKSQTDPLGLWPCTDHCDPVNAKQGTKVLEVKFSHALQLVHPDGVDGMFDALDTADKLDHLTRLGDLAAGAASGLAKAEAKVGAALAGGAAEGAASNPSGQGVPGADSSGTMEAIEKALKGLDALKTKQEGTAIWVKVGWQCCEEEVLSRVDAKQLEGQVGLEEVHR